MIFEEEKVEGLIVQCRLREASAALMLDGAPRRARAMVYAMAGDDRGLARVVDSALLGCRGAAEVANYYLRTELEPTAGDRFVTAVVLAWASDAPGCYAALGVARDTAISERRFHLAVAAGERLAHHALLFGNLDLARRAIDEAVGCAAMYRLNAWFPRCLAIAARLALDAGENEQAGELLERARAAANSPEEMTLLAAIGAQLAIELGDDDLLRRWSTPEIVEMAQRSERPEVSISGTIAALLAAGAPEPNSSTAAALRRALFQEDSAANAPELFTIVAHYGELEDATIAVNALGAAVAPNRPYLHAHHLLARAHALLRAGERLGCVDAAGDAARAFATMGLRRWTNEAMRLLVSQEQGSQRLRGRPSGAALTEREQQVAQLIRRGARNREVATALQISEHTVERHVSSILGRLGLRSRWQIADPRKDAEH